MPPRPTLGCSKNPCWGVLCPTTTIFLFAPSSRFCLLLSEGFVMQVKNSPGHPGKEQGWAQGTHLSLEALEPHDVLTAGGVLLPKVLPEGVDLQGELPLHLWGLQRDTSWGYPRWSPHRRKAVISSCPWEDRPRYNFCTGPSFGRNFEACRVCVREKLILDRHWGEQPFRPCWFFPWGSQGGTAYDFLPLQNSMVTLVPYRKLSFPQK